VEVKWLNKCIQSVKDQVYPNWELCLHDDASNRQETLSCLKRWEGSDDRIKISYGKTNQHISAATNKALQMAIGEFVALLDHDDEISHDALYEVVKALNENPHIDMLYSDEDKIERNGQFVDPHFKPDWSPETFESMMYTCHFGVFRRSLIEKIGGFRAGYEGSQDYDLVLRFSEITSRIHHIPKVLYHWRKIPGSTAEKVSAKHYAYDAAVKALSDRLLREHHRGRVQRSLWTGSYRFQRETERNPLISIIIPFRDQSDYLKRCLESVLKSSYEHFEILLVSNNSEQKKTFAVVQDFLKRDDRLRSFEYNHPFNFSAINNWAVCRARGEVLLLLNNDTEVINSDWMEALLELAQRKNIGAVGAKLLYPDDTIQHAGVVLGIGGVASHAFKGFSRYEHGYSGYASVVRNYAAVTGACLMVEKKKFLEVGGFDEKNLSIAFNDVDFCLKLLKAGYRNVYTPFAELYHYESLTRGTDDTPEKQRRFATECQYMLDHWGDLLRNDPYYNPNLSLEREDFSLKL